MSTQTAPSLFFLSPAHPEVRDAWTQAGCVEPAGSEDADSQESLAFALRAAQDRPADLYLVHGDVFPHQDSDFAPYTLPQPSPDRIVTPTKTSSPFVNHASLWRQANAKDHMIYPAGYPFSHRFRGQQYDWSDNTHELAPGVWTWPCDPPLLDGCTQLVIPQITCRGLALLNEQARGFVVAPGALLPPGGAVLVALEFVPVLASLVGGVGWWPALYRTQLQAHRALAAVGLGLPVLRRVPPRVADTLRGLPSELEAYAALEKALPLQAPGAS